MFSSAAAQQDLEQFVLDNFSGTQLTVGKEQHSNSNNIYTLKTLHCSAGCITNRFSDSASLQIRLYP